MPRPSSTRRVSSPRLAKFLRAKSPRRGGQSCGNGGKGKARSAGRTDKREALRVVLAQPRGFCAGVVRAIEIVERALQKYDAPVYVRHEIVHNKRVVDALKAKGAHFVEEISDIPDGAVAIFSAHGVARSVEDEAAGAAPDRPQRHLPAGHQGPQSGQALCGAGPRADPDRPRRPPRGRGHDRANSRPRFIWSRRSRMSPTSTFPPPRPSPTSRRRR